MLDVSINEILIRKLGGVLDMEMRVVKIEDGVIHCTAVDEPTQDITWEFDQVTGAEIDEDLRWGPKYGVTGSFLRKKDK